MTDPVAEALEAAGASKADAVSGASRLMLAAARIREKQARRDLLPSDAALLAELEGPKPLHELRLDARAALARAGFMALKDRLGAPFRAPYGWDESSEAQERLAALDPEMVDGLRRWVAADLRERRKAPQFPVTQNVDWGARSTKRGQPPRFADFDFACCVYVVMLDACGVKPGRTWNPYTGEAGGRFHAVLGAAMNAHGFGRRGYGADKLIRDVLAWMAPDGSPDPDECEFARARWLNDEPE